MLLFCFEIWQDKYDTKGVQWDISVWWDFNLLCIYAFKLSSMHIDYMFKNILCFTHIKYFYYNLFQSALASIKLGNTRVQVLAQILTPLGRGIFVSWLHSIHSSLLLLEQTGWLDSIWSPLVGLDWLTSIMVVAGLGSPWWRFSPWHSILILVLNLRK